MKPARLRASQKQEARVAKSLGGRRQAQSGAGPWAKNDVKSEKYLVECKRTDNLTQITIKLKDIQDVARHAALEGKLPLFAIEIGNKRYFVVEEWVWDSHEDA